MPNRRGTRRIQRVRQETADRQANRAVRLIQADAPPAGTPAYLPPSIAQQLLEMLDEEPDAPETLPCPVCRGPLTLLGELGTRAHFRCRNCGIELSMAPEGQSR